MIPTTSFAGISKLVLYVGNTLVYEEELAPDYINPNPSGKSETTYWKETAAGSDFAYENTGTINDYKFSVYYDYVKSGFMLTLNGVDITTVKQYDVYGDEINAGIYTNGNMGILLADNTENSINIPSANSSSGHGIFCANNMMVAGNGSLDISGGLYGIYSYNSLSLMDACLSSSGTVAGLYSILINVHSGKIYTTGTGEEGIGMATVDYIDIMDGIVIAKGSKIAINPNIELNDTINTPYIDYLSKYKTNTSTTEPESDYTLSTDKEFINSIDLKYVEIIITPPILVGANSISGIKDKGNIVYLLNDGNGDYNPNSIKNVEYTNDAKPFKAYYDQCGIFAGTDLNIILEGNNIIGNTDNPPHYGIKTFGTLSISSDTDGSLSIVGDGGKSVGIRVNNKISINGANISVEGTDAGVLVDYRSSRYYYEDYSNLALDNGSIKLDSKLNAIYFDTPDSIIRLPEYYKYKLNASDDYSFGGFVYSEDQDYVEIISVFEITKASPVNGDFTISSNSTPAAIASKGDIIDLKATPNTGYEFSGWNVYKTGDTSTRININNNSFVMPSYPVTVSANFTEIEDNTPAPSKTIVVTETSSPVFTNTEGSILAQANMTNAFSNSVEVKVTDTEEDSANFNLGVGNTVYPFDISLYIKGTNTKTNPKEGYAVTISLPIPKELLDVKDQMRIAHKAADGTVTILQSEVKQINGIWYLVFEANEFSPYALVVSSTATYNPELGLPYYLDSNNKEMFIGFAANGKYLAPTGTNVLFKNNSKEFTDINNHWAENNIRFITEREVFLGTGNGKFSPNSSMTRAMFATVIGRLYERSFGAIELSEKQVFTDCNYDDYYGKYVDWASENGIVKGYGNGTFKPNAAVSREEMATIIYRFADYLKAVGLNIDTELEFSDSLSISTWAVDAALYSQTNELITGRANGTFAPKGIATRAEVSTIIERFIKCILK